MPKTALGPLTTPNYAKKHGYTAFCKLSFIVIFYTLYIVPPHTPL